MPPRKTPSQILMDSLLEMGIESLRDTIQTAFSAESLFQQPQQAHQPHLPRFGCNVPGCRTGGSATGSPPGRPNAITPNTFSIVRFICASLRVVNRSQTDQNVNSPVLSPNVLMSSMPSLCIRLSITLAIGVPSGAFRC